MILQWLAPLLFDVRSTAEVQEGRIAAHER
jgi:hypothetical protein